MKPISRIRRRGDTALGVRRRAASCLAQRNTACGLRQPLKLSRGEPRVKESRGRLEVELPATARRHDPRRLEHSSRDVRPSGARGRLASRNLTPAMT